MTTTPYDQPRRPHLAGWLPFIRHYIEMVLAMAIGMVALHPLAMFAFQAAGATGKGRELNERDRWLVSQIGPALRDRGMLFVGIDVIGGYVTEINVTSPTGIRELDKQFKCDIATLLIQAIEKRRSAH